VRDNSRRNKRPDLRRDCDLCSFFPSCLPAFAGETNDLIYEGIAICLILPISRLQWETNDLIYEGIAIFQALARLITGDTVAAETNDLIYEGIAMTPSTISSVVPILETNDLIYEGIAIPRSYPGLLPACKRPKQTT